MKFQYYCTGIHFFLIIFLVQNILPLGNRLQVIYDKRVTMSEDKKARAKMIFRGGGGGFPILVRLKNAGREEMATFFFSNLCFSKK